MLLAWVSFIRCYWVGQALSYAVRLGRLYYSFGWVDDDSIGVCEALMRSFLNVTMIALQCETLFHIKWLLLRLTRMHLNSWTQRTKHYRNDSHFISSTLCVYPKLVSLISSSFFWVCHGHRYMSSSSSLYIGYGCRHSLLAREITPMSEVLLLLKKGFPHLTLSLPLLL